MTGLTTATASVSSARHDALSRAVDLLLVVMVAANALQILWLVASVDGATTVDIGFALSTQWVPVAIFWLLTARAGFRSLPLIFAASGITLSAIGDTFYSFAMDGDGFLAFPSPADGFYLLFYPLMVLALVTLVRRHLVGASGLVLLETAVVSVGAAAVLAAVLDPVIGGALASGTAIGSAIAVSYPLLDLVLVAVIVGSGSVAALAIPRRAWALLVGLGIFAVADIAYALLETQGSYVAGTPLDAAWSVGLAFITWWGARIAVPTEAPADTPRGFMIPLAPVAVLAGLALLVAGTQLRLSTLAVVLAALTVALGAVPIIFRQAMLGRMLADQQEAVRRLTELDEAKSELLTTVNHEFRTPLTSLNGHVELLLDGSAGELPAGAIEMLRTVERNGSRLQALVDQTFLASRLEDREQLFVRSPVDVLELTASAVTHVAPAAREREVAINVVHEGEIPHVDADGPHLQRAIVNVVNNAVKFSPRGGFVTVTVAAPPPRSDVVVRVRDDGMGVPSDEVGHLFTRFFRASNAQRAAIPGVGLGLSITRQIVHAHGGTINVDSAEGRGTTVEIRLPAPSRLRRRPRFAATLPRLRSYLTHGVAARTPSRGE